MTRVARSVSLCSVALLGLVLPIAGFASAGPDSTQPQTGCSRTITRVGDVHAALGAASPGDTLCFTGADLADADLTLTRSGTADALIRLVSDGHTTVHEIHIITDHVLIQGNRRRPRRRNRRRLPSGFPRSRQKSLLTRTGIKRTSRSYPPSGACS